MRCNPVDAVVVSFGLASAGLEGTVLRIFTYTPYKSLSRFSVDGLPSFVVLVGLNGAGKSQLLEAIEQRRIACTPLSNPQLNDGERHPGVVRLTNASLNLQSEMLINAVSSDKPSRTIFDEHRSRVYWNQDSAIRVNFPKAAFGNTPEEVMALSTDELVHGPDGEDDLTKQAKLRAFLGSINIALGTQHYDTRHAPARLALNKYNAAGLGESRLVTYEELITFGSWGEHGMFDSQLTRLFGGYRDEALRNDRLAAKNGRPPEAGWLDPVAFKEKFGPAPWDHLSDILASFNLNYRIAAPGSRAIDPIVLYFERLDDNGIHVQFADLSAGEKVLVILAIALMNVDPIRAVMRRPELLLLDEIDASLHPAVLHQWMSTIQEKVVGERGISCIITTHSPVTVALAPEASLYEMARSATPLRKIKKQEALNNLTVGLPSMEIEFTQRRQVFVEAEVDAEAYDLLYSRLKNELRLPRSLNFLSTGIKNKNGIEQGTGCDAVRKVVTELEGFGSLSTFGLLDWDGKREPTNRIKVLAKGSHYAFDNVILNPLLIGILLIRFGEPPAGNLPRFVGIDHAEAAELQAIADAVQSKLTYADDAPTGQTGVEFTGGISIMTDTGFCETNGHAIEGALAKEFPLLKKFTQKKGQLALTVIEKVLGDCPQLCPQLIADAYRELANADP